MSNQQDNLSPHSPSMPIYYKILMMIVAVLALVVGGVFVWQNGLADNRTFTALTPENSAIAILRTVQRETDTITEPEFTIRADPESLADHPVSVAMDMVSLEELENGSTRVAEWIPRARDSLLHGIHQNLIPTTPIYVLDIRASVPIDISLTFNPQYPADSLDVYGWDSDNQTWRFIPNTFDYFSKQVTLKTTEIPAGVALFRHTSRQSEVIGRLNFNQTISQEIQSVITIASPIGMMPAIPSQDGQTLQGNPATGFMTNQGYRVMPLISNRTHSLTPDTTAVLHIFDDEQLRRDHVREIATFTHAGSYAGVFIDYQAIPADHHPLYLQFLADLKRTLDETGAKLGVIVPEPLHLMGEWHTAYYDWAELGAIVDYVVVEVGLNPEIFVIGDHSPYQQMIEWGVTQVPRQKLIISLTSQAIYQQDDLFATVTYREALRNLGNLRILTPDQRQLTQTIMPETELLFDLDGMNVASGHQSAIRTPYIDYLNVDDEPIARIWLTTPRALNHRLNRLSSYHVGGAYFSDLFQSHHSSDLQAVIKSYRTYDVPPINGLEDDLRLRWEVAGQQGVISQFTTRFDEPVVVTLSAPDGNYAVRVDVIAGDELYNAQDSVSIALAYPSSTPTPLPYATSRPHPTPTPTLIPIYPTIAPPEVIVSSGGGHPLPPASTHAVLFGAPSNPITGSLSLSGFEYGGHVMDMASQRAIPVMQGIGMTWMKVQVRFSPGTNLDHAAYQIQSAHRNGFKALIGIVGDPRDVSAGGANYLREYAHFAAQVAHLGADAIEVWNEPNLGREWPSGSISGGNYTALLAETFNAIKASNPNTIVISGAPAPTGAQAAFPNDVVNDDTFLTQMVNAGALNYMDCLGVHYNEGILPPTATSGDPRGDNYYTRYLPRLLDRYRQITGSRRPICITELGYLSPEGFGALPSSFAWASGMDNARHASYLAGALQYVAQSRDIRMVIVWNIDFTRYDSDPMGGYAIIRPDGGCPACGAIAGIR